MSGINVVALTGNVGQDPELKHSKDGKSYTRFSIAVHRYVPNDPEAKPMWINVVAFDKTAEFCSHLGKGNMITVQGELDVSEWTDKDNQVRLNVSIKARSVVGPKEAAIAMQSAKAAGATPGTTTTKPGVSDEDIPF